MNKLLDDYLCKKYPLIFKDRNAPMTETCMCWGFPESGWFFLLDCLCEGIQYHIDNPSYKVKESILNKLGSLWNRTVWNWILFPITNKCLPYKVYNKCFRWLSFVPRMEEEKIPQVVALQVKEKFGGLRFYYTGGDERIAGMVQLAEMLSYHICEKCGVMNETVSQNSTGWILTSCPSCSRKSAQAEHQKNLNPELVDIFDKIRKEPKVEKEWA